MLLRRNGDRARLRRRDFNHALSATEHYSVSSPVLAGSKRATEHGKTIGFRASGVRCDSRHATSVRKRKRLGGASRFIPLQSVRAAQPRMGLGRRFSPATKFERRSQASSCVYEASLRVISSSFACMALRSARSSGVGNITCTATSGV